MGRQTYPSYRLIRDGHPEWGILNHGFVQIKLRLRVSASLRDSNCDSASLRDNPLPGGHKVP